LYQLFPDQFARRSDCHSIAMHRRCTPLLRTPSRPAQRRAAQKLSAATPLPTSPPLTPARNTGGSV